MAYTKTVWTNEGGQSLNETNLNKIEQGIYDAHQASNIKTWYESNLDTNAYTDAEKTFVASVDTRLTTLENTGMTVMGGSSLTPQSIATSATKVVLFDSIVVDTGVGTSGDLVNQRATAGLDGIYKIRLEAFVSYPSATTITWEIYKNGSPTGYSINLPGHNSEIFSIILVSALELLTDDYLELYATASTTETITISHSNGTLEKTHYQ